MLGAQLLKPLPATSQVHSNRQLKLKTAVKQSQAHQSGMHEYKVASQAGAKFQPYPMSFVVHLFPTPQPVATISLFSVSVVLPFPESPTNGIINYFVFGVYSFLQIQLFLVTK